MRGGRGFAIAKRGFQRVLIICEDWGSWETSGPGDLCDVCLGSEVGSVFIAAKVWEGRFSIGRGRTAVGVAKQEWKWPFSWGGWERRSCNSREDPERGILKRKINQARRAGWGGAGRVAQPALHGICLYFYLIFNLLI